MKEYIFTLTEFSHIETSVEAKSYEDAVNIYLADGGNAYEVDSNISDWDCILNSDGMTASMKERGDASKVQTM